MTLTAFAARASNPTADAESGDSQREGPTAGSTNTPPATPGADTASNPQAVKCRLDRPARRTGGIDRARTGPSFKRPYASMTEETIAKRKFHVERILATRPEMAHTTQLLPPEFLQSSGVGPNKHLLNPSQWLEDLTKQMVSAGADGQAHKRPYSPEPVEEDNDNDDGDHGVESIGARISKRRKTSRR